MRRFSTSAAAVVSSLLLMSVPAAADESMHATTTVDGLTVSSTITAPKGTHGQWYVAVHDAGVSPQTVVAQSPIGRYPAVKTLSATVPMSAFGSGCKLVAQVDVRFGGTRHRTTTLVPGGIHRITLTKPNCTPSKPPVKPPTISPPTISPPTVTPPTVTPPVRHVPATPPAPAGVSAAAAAAPAQAVAASVTFTG